MADVGAEERMADVRAEERMADECRIVACWAQNAASGPRADKSLPLFCCIPTSASLRYNVANGGPAVESVTDAIYAHTKSISRIATCAAFPDIDLSKVGTTVVRKGAASDAGAHAEVTVEVIDSVDDYGRLLARVFDFSALAAFLARPDFRIAYDALSGGAAAAAGWEEGAWWEGLLRRARATSTNLCSASTSI